MNRRITLSFLSGAAVAGMLALAFLHWTLGNATPLRFGNRSGITLHDVTISGSGFEASLGDVEPGETVRVRVYPSGESSMRIAFRASGTTRSLTQDVYFEGGGDYDITVTMEPNMKAIVNVDSLSLRGMLLP